MGYAGEGRRARLSVLALAVVTLLSAGSLIVLVAGPAAAAGLDLRVPRTGQAEQPVALAARITPVINLVPDPGESSAGPSSSAANPMVFTITGDNLGTRSVAVADADGWYRTTYTPTRAGTDQVSARLGDLTAGPVDIVVSPAPTPDPVVTLTPRGGTSEIGTELTVTASVRGGSGSGRWSISVAGRNGPRDIFTSESSGDPVQVTASYTGEVAGEDEITATWRDFDERSDTASVTHTWTEPPVPPAVVSLTVTPADRSVVGSTATVAASVTGGSGEGYWVIDVAGVNGPKRILGDGEVPPGGRTVTAQYTGENVGTDTVTATWTDYDRRVSPARESVDHSWIAPPRPGVALRPETGSSLVGTQLELVLTVSGADGRGPGRPSVTVGGANAGARPVLSGDSSPYTIRYTGTRTGQDTITATWTDRFGDTTATATHDWTAPRVQLTGGGPAADLGDAVTFRVALPDGNLDGTVEIRVIEGPHARLLEATGSGSAFEAGYTGHLPGTDRIQATLVTEAYGSFSSEVRSQAWNTPTVRLDPDPGRSLVGDTHTVTARVTGTRSGEVTFTVAGANTGAMVEASGRLPSVIGTYTGRAPGDDRITAEVTVGGRRYVSAELRHSWVRPQVVLSQDTEVSKTGETVVLTATVAPSGIEGAVTFSIDGDGGPLVFRDDGTDGSWTASYSRDRRGEDTITATLAGGAGASFAAEPIRHRWAASVPPAVVLSPAGATSCTGSTFSPTVTVTDEGNPVATAPVRLVVTPATGAAQELTGTTDADGHLTLPVQATAAGTETLRATADVNGTPVESAPMPHLWEDCALRVAIAPAGTTSPVRSTFAPTVTVLDAVGSPVVDARVELQVTSPERSVIERELLTGSTGTVSTAYSREEAGTDRIDVVVTAGDRTGRATADHFWVEADGLQVSLAPAGTTSLAGSPFTATVLVTDEGKPVDAAQVTFRATMSDVVAPATPGPVVAEPRTTGPDGQASVTFTRAVAGTDTVSAEVVVGERSGRAAILHFWEQVPGVTLTLEPPGASTVIGTDFTVTATVEVGGEPTGGLELAFRATMDGQPEQTRAATSGADGRATFTYRRDTVGPDVVAVTVVLADGRRGQASIAHLWRDADLDAPVQPQPVEPDLDVEGTPIPAGLVTLVGRGCPAGSSVELLIDGRVVARTTARRDGSYSAEVRLPGLAVGQYPLEAVCPPVRVPRTIDVVVPTASTGTAAAGTTTAAAVLGFFVLLGGQLVRLSGAQSGSGS